MVISVERTGWDRWSLTVVRLAVTAAIAELSYVVLEQPIRRGRVTDHAVLTGVDVTSAALLLASFTISAPPARFSASQDEVATADLPDVADTTPLDSRVVRPPARTDGTISPTLAPDDAAAISEPQTAEPTEIPAPPRCIARRQIDERRHSGWFATRQTDTQPPDSGRRHW